MKSIIYKVAKDDETNEYYTERTDMSGIDELNAIKFLAEDFKERINSKAGKEEAEDLLWHAIHGSTFIMKNGELYVKPKKGLD